MQSQLIRLFAIVILWLNSGLLGLAQLDNHATGLPTDNGRTDSQVDLSGGLKPDRSASDRLFRAALDGVAPLSPEQIREFRFVIDRMEQAAESPMLDLTPVIRSVAVSTKSGEPPVQLMVKPGWLTSLTFSDTTGQPWPVDIVTVGNPDAYDVGSSGPEGSSNIITLSALRSHIHTNLSVLLLEADVPLLFTLVPAAEKIDFRIDVRVDQRGPNALPGTTSGKSLPSTNDGTMIAFLDGVAPDAAVPLHPGSGSDLQVWRFGKRMYVRTKLDLLSPAFSARHSNSSGVKVFVLEETPVLLLTDGGRMSFVKLNP